MRRLRTRGDGARGVDWIVLGLVAALALSADQATKAIIRGTLAVGEEAAGIGPFGIHHVRNSGILGGHLQGSGLVIGALTTLVVAGIFVYFARRGHAHPLFPIAFGLLAGGAVGNLVDRLRLGYVTDFIARDAEKAANLADVAIVIGLAVLLAASLFPRRSPGGQPRREGDGEASPAMEDGPP